MTAPSAREAKGAIAAEQVKIIQEYDVAADAKKRVSLRGATAKHFRVKALSNGSFLLEPQVLIPRALLPARILKTIEDAAANLKLGKVSEPIDLSSFKE